MQLLVASVVSPAYPLGRTFAYTVDSWMPFIQTDVLDVARSIVK